MLMNGKKIEEMGDHTGTADDSSASAPPPPQASPAPSSVAATPSVGVVEVPHVHVPGVGLATNLLLTQYGINPR